MSRKSARRKLLLLHHIPQEQGVAADIPSHIPLWFFYQAIKPLQSMFLPPNRGTLHSTGKEIEDGTDGTYMAVEVLLIPMKTRLFRIVKKQHKDTYPKTKGAGGSKLRITSLLTTSLSF